MDSSTLILAPVAPTAPRRVRKDVRAAERPTGAWELPVTAPDLDGTGHPGRSQGWLTAGRGVRAGVTGVPIAGASAGQLALMDVARSVRDVTAICRPRGGMERASATTDGQPVELRPGTPARIDPGTGEDPPATGGDQFPVRSIAPSSTTHSPPARRPPTPTQPCTPPPARSCRATTDRTPGTPGPARHLPDVTNTDGHGEAS